MTHLSYEEFIAQVQNRGDLSFDDAERAIASVLTTLREHLSGGEAADVAGQLPAELRGHLNKDRMAPAEQFSVDEFLRRVGHRYGVDPEEGERLTTAVLITFDEALSRDEIADVRSEMPAGLKSLLKAKMRIHPKE